MNRLQANICLLAATLCWSSEVVIFSVIPEGVSPFATMCTTSLIGAALVFLVFFRRIIAAIRRDGRKLVGRIALLSGINCTYNTLIIFGLNYFNLSSGAFTLSMTMVVLPVMLLVMRRGVETRTWISASMVFAGVLVAIVPSYETPQLPGIVIIVVACILRALFIVKLADFAQEHDPVTLSAGISGFNALFSFIPWCIVQPGTFTALPWSSTLIASLVIYSYFVVAFATTLNVFAQRRATAAEATIIYSTEIVFSILWAVCLPAGIIDPVQMSIPIVAGCVLIVAGNIVQVVRIGKKTDSADIDAADRPIESSPVEPIIENGPGVVQLLRRGTDPVWQMLSGIRGSFARCLALFTLLLGVYLVVALPFKVLAIIPGFTDVRPVCLLQPVYGIFFGPPGCLAFACGNFIGDVASDSLRWSSIAGFIGNFLYCYLMYLVWVRLARKGFNLQTGRRILAFIGTVMAFAFVQAAIITPAVAIIYPDVDFVLFAITVILNSSLFSIGLAIPGIMLFQDELGMMPYGRKHDGSQKIGAPDTPGRSLHA